MNSSFLFANLTLTFQRLSMKSYEKLFFKPYESKRFVSPFEVGRYLIMWIKGETLIIEKAKKIMLVEPPPRVELGLSGLPMPTLIH